MSEADEAVVVARQWVEKAENDLLNANHTLKLGATCPTDTVCFHAQQCVEKYLKAILSLRGIDFPKTHNIAELVGRLPRNISLSFSVEEQELLADYATVTRYPGDYEPITLKEARQAVKLVKRLRQALRKYLPKPVLSQRLPGQ